MSEAGKAVFLSYAHEDAAAAKRIAEALRAFGVEVWFDQSELRGGDQWDQNIRQQIKSCALFIPVISATTQARDEAYFRLEWKLADDRSHLMAAGKAFIVPVVIDATPETGAAVPESFNRAHWTRLADGEAAAPFVAQVKRLLEAPKKPVLKTDNPRPPTLPPGFKTTVKAETDKQLGRAHRARPWGLIAAVIFVLGAAVAYVALRNSESPPTQPTEATRRSAPPTPDPSRPLAADAKSVAVLAFANLSDDKGNEYFSDGISEELLNVLAKVPGLKVSARTSAFHFKGKDTAIRDIARQLGVAYVVEGSVRKQGDKVRITVQLIKAADGFHAWSEKFDRDAKDIFAVQDEIAQTIVTQLRGLLTGEAPDAATLFAIRGQVRAASKGGTTNAAAYEQYLLGRFHANLGTMEDYARAEGYFRRATELDPAFALGLIGLSRTHIRQGQFTEVPAEMPRHFAQAAQAVDRALALEPTLAEGHGAKAEILILSKYDWRGADQAVRQALALAPRDPAILDTAGFLAQLTGQIDRSIALRQQAIETDPLNVLTILYQASNYTIQRRYPEAAALRRRVLEINPQAMQVHAAQADDYVMQGRFDEAMEELQKEPPGFARDIILANALWGQGKIQESEEALNRLKALGDFAGGLVAFAYGYRQDVDQAFVWLERGLQGGDVGVVQSKMFHHLNSLHADPRWSVWLRKLGLHDDQLAEFIPDFQETKFTPPAVSPPKGAAPVFRPRAVTPPP